ncbi:protease inhibitor I42 family protein [Mycolicibacterium sp. CH28]|uniref:protease inhibitor I42 family protein n=1 Tax=Mycolicibacterium sp. CH28 TaxID=2512237 RepID=UPI0013874F39|nr:protease inhibitor I42 family protein [Mycolicibacterium sp. CH28]
MIQRLAALPLIAITLVGCSSPEHPSAPAAKTTTVEVPYDELLNQKRITRDVELHVGDTLRVVLASNASTGYQWSAQAQIGDPAVLTQRSHDVAGPTDALPGASGTETWTFEAAKTGTSTLTTTYGQPWPGGAKDAWTFTATVGVH